MKKVFTSTINISAEEKEQLLRFAAVRGSAMLATYMGFPDNGHGFHKKQTATYIETKAENLEYHSNWSWLMPVVEKICSETFEDGERVFFRTFGMKDGESDFFLSRIERHQLFRSQSLINATFLSCVDYVAYRLADR